MTVTGVRATLPDANDHSISAPNGYKPTDAGVIPHDWDLKQLREIADFKNGRPHESDITHDGAYQLVTLDSIAIEGNLKRNHKTVNVCDDSLKRDDIVAILSDLAHGNLLGLCDVIPANGTFVLNQRVGRLRLKTNDLPQFVRHQINRQQSHFKRRGQGTSQRHVYRRDFDSLWITLPSESEQRAIAEALSDVDALITSLDKLIAKKRAIKQGAMQQLLTGRTRLPGFRGDWETKRLGEISSISMGRTPSRHNAKFWGGSHVWLSIADLKEKVVSCSTEQITDLAAATMTPVPKGTLLMSFKLSIGRLCFAGCDLFTNEAICSFASLKADPEYLYYALGRVDFFFYGKQAVKGYTLNKESLRIIDVPLPEPAEQAAIASVLSDIDSEIEALERRRNKTKHIKQGMMQQLLTGRIRLPIAETAEATT